MIRLADYLAKMFAESPFDQVALLDNLSPTEINNLSPERTLDAFLEHLQDKRLSIKFPQAPSLTNWFDKDSRILVLLECTDRNRLTINLNSSLAENKAALDSIMALELCRFLIEQNEIAYSIHSTENLQLPDVAMHILGLSDVFLHGCEEANRIWPQYFERPMFSRLRYQQHRSLANYVDNLEETFAFRNASSIMTIEEMERQLFQYMNKNQEILKKEFERTQKAHPHLSKKEIYEKMLYEWKREFRI